MQKLSFVYNYSENRATRQIWKVFPNMVFPLIFGGKWRRSEHAHASYCGLSFCPPGLRPYKDWTGLGYHVPTIGVYGNHNGI